MNENQEYRAAASTKGSESATVLPEDLSNQLGHAVAMAAKEDQIVWAIFGVFWGANAVLLVALFTRGSLPNPPVGVIVASSGVALSWVWFMIQRRAIGWLRYYEEIICQLEKNHLRMPHEVALSASLNTPTVNRTVGQGLRVRPLIVGSGFAVAVLWSVALVWFACRLTI